MKYVSHVDRLDRSTWPDVLRAADLAVIYAMSLQKIYRKARRGELPPRAPGREYIWGKATVCDYFDHPLRYTRGQRVA